MESVRRGPSALQVAGSSSASSSALNLERLRPSRARFDSRSSEIAPMAHKLDELAQKASEKIQANQDAKKRAAEKKAAASRTDKGKQRAEPQEARHVSSRTSSVDSRRTRSSTAEDTWDMDLGDGSAMDYDSRILDDIAKNALHSSARPARPAPVAPSKSSASSVVYTKAIPKQSVPVPAKHPPSIADSRRPISAPLEQPKGASTSTSTTILSHKASRTTSISNTRQPSPAAAKPPPIAAAAKPAPQPAVLGSTQPSARPPPALGMRRVNTHSGATSTFRPSQDIPTKQRGFKTPFARPGASQGPASAASSSSAGTDPSYSARVNLHVTSEPSSSFPVAPDASSLAMSARPPQARAVSSRSPSPDAAPAEADSSYGEISFDADELNEIMSQYD